ncbi:bifunctional DNA primase/polymerase [Amycolatopsis benzoatilytica]|uniref:bifunctional DNA primase/polymerase n=1 Tax=Amycolatopsis benzoatilytica TaxID=346045 RepID=UPI00037C1BD0|nr:bifunctional DNA primase/polymerase [Amycolatopsis benzoatilytica]
MIGRFHPEPGRLLGEIRDAAMDYVEHGWHIQPGTYQVHGSRHWHGHPHADGLEPIAHPWSDAGIADTDLACEVWTRRPYAILLACGPVVDALEIPAALGAGLTQPLRAADCLPPTVVTPFGTWLLLTSPGEPIRLDLAQQPGIGVRRRGTWIALPPTTHGHLPYRWRMHPRAVGWSVPSARAVQHVLAEAVTPAYRRSPHAGAAGLARLPFGQDGGSGGGTR